MKPSKIRNRTVHHPPLALRSKQMSSHLSAELRKSHNTRSVRVIPGDTVAITRGEYEGTGGKVDKVDPTRGVAISGMKEEKPAGQKYDVYMHPSNLVITALNLDDKWRANKIKGHESTKKSVVKSKDDTKAETATVDDTAKTEIADADVEDDAAKTDKNREENQ